MPPTARRLTRDETVLAALAAGRGAVHTPVQVQKLLFLLERNLGDTIGTHFSFQPYHYGPFDQNVYNTLETLAARGFVEIVQELGDRWRSYRLTREGQQAGDDALACLHEQARIYAGRLSDFVRSLSFSELVSAVYAKYPEMRANSVFQG
jgi:uncharacterized protein YwgA